MSSVKPAVKALYKVRCRLSDLFKELQTGVDAHGAPTFKTDPQSLEKVILLQRRVSRLEDHLLRRRLQASGLDNARKMIEGHYTE